MYSLGVWMLALVFPIHIVMVNLGMGLAWIVPYLKWRADRGERELEKPARSLMRFYGATYAVGGVFATAFTVFLLSFYPHFLRFAGDITMIPFGIAILMIVLHFFSLSAFWYGWDRWSRGTHYFIGALMAASAFLIPFGFRAIFAFLNIPAGLGYDPVHHKFYLNVVDALTKNPTFWALYLKSIVAAFTATAIVVMGAMAYKYYITDDEEEKRGALRLAKMMAIPAAIGLALMFPLGIWYAVSLENIPYKFNNIFASLGWSVGNGKAYFNVSWLFVLKMLFVLFQVFALAYGIPALLHDRIEKKHAKVLLAAGLAALATIAAGELLNAFSQYPFFVAAWPDILTGHIALSKLASYGIHIPKQSLPSIIPAINSVVLVDNSPTAYHILKELGIAKLFPQASSVMSPVNPIATIPSIEAITIGFFIFLLSAAAYYVLYVLLWPTKTRAEQVAEAKKHY